MNRRNLRFHWCWFAFVLLAMFGEAQAQQAEWPTYGGDPGGQRYSSADQINRENVRQLHIAWVYHTHALDSGRAGTISAMFETTPVLFGGALYLTTPFDEIVALDPLTGIDRWKYRPKMRDLHEGDLTTSRGVAVWGSMKAGVPCSARIFVGTNDARLIGVDAETGAPCKDFGRQGVVDLAEGMIGDDRGFHVTSAPTVLGNTVIVGSSIPDNQLAAQAKGTVRAYDAITGKKAWTWEPLPWDEKWAGQTGAANSWSTIAADRDLGLVYIPTGSASPDYFGGLRPGDNRDADSIVAIEAATGRKVWAFQLVHHDLWDYDVASEPLLFTWHQHTPAVAVISKMGMVFVLDRRTGKPLFPVEERPVPLSDVLGESPSPTQPFSTLPSMTPLVLGDERMRDNSLALSESCREQMSKLRYDGIYTPPSLKGSLIFPGSIGGVNWGSAAYDPVNGILYATTNRLPYAVQLVPQSFFPSTFQRTGRILFALRIPLFLLLTIGVSLALVFWKRARNGWTFGALVLLTCVTGFVWRQARQGSLKHADVRSAISGAFGDDHSPQTGAPYSLFRHPILDQNGAPCTPGFWGTITALNLQAGKLVWEKAHGSQPPGIGTGALSLGGVIVTAGGLVFSAGTRESVIRAYDASTGEELWKGNLPVPAQSTPMTYQINGRQFVVIAAGGHGLWGTPTGDAVVGFTLD